MSDRRKGKDHQPSLDLGRSRILYVGGHHQSVQHLRRVVEAHNGTFDHHDGGVEESISRLQGLLSRADAVLFPVRLVSHSAQSTVKQLCRRFDKPYAPLRGAGLKSVVEALQALSAEAAAPTA